MRLSSPWYPDGVFSKVTDMGLQKVAFIAALSSVSLAALATGATIEQGPSGAGTVSGPFNDTTSGVFPQISEVVRFEEVRPANPKRSPGIPLGNGPAEPVPSIVSSTQATMGAKFPGIGYTFLDPPDPHIAVGNSHVVEVVNTAIAFFDKNGNKQFQQNMDNSGFFAGVAQTNFVFDPKVVFDAKINRFIVIALEQRDSPANSGILLAVSDDGNPNGSWTKYRIEAKATKNSISYWFDYPSVGSNKDGLVIAGNQFSFNSNNFGFARSYVLKKSELAAGGTVHFFFFDHLDDFTLQPAKTLENVTSTIYGASVRNSSTFTFYSWRNLTTTPVFNRVNVTIPTFVSMTSNAASMGGAQLDPLSDRMMDTSFRSGSLLVAHTVRVSAADNRAMIRWYEFLVGSWPASGSITRKQFGNVTLASPNHVMMPAISKNGKGAISILFSRSSTSRAADLYTVSHKSTDPLNSMGPFTAFATSPGVYSAGFHRWGDYFGATVDPSDPAKFWGVGELIKTNTTWTTEIRSWSVN